jgi:hypothetical protein
VWSRKGIGFPYPLAMSLGNGCVELKLYEIPKILFSWAGFQTGGGIFFEEVLSGVNCSVFWTSLTSVVEAQ